MNYCQFDHITKLTQKRKKNTTDEVCETGIPNV
jgi:hypothetical protein